MKKLFVIFTSLYSINAFGLFTETIPHQCGTISTMSAVLTLNQYTCQPGEYLPAYTLGCQPCPSGYTCNGGTYEFNEDAFQGATKSTTYINNDLTTMCAVNALHVFFAVLTPNVHTCTPGYYLPANIDECTQCLNDNYCPGGTYTFNETTADGITPCPSENPYAPAGMWLQSQCGQKLHIADDVIYFHQSPAYPTTHRLFVRSQNGGTYSVNAIPKDINANTQPKMSAGMSKEFHIMMDNVEYLICDDSIPECRNTPPTN